MVGAVGHGVRISFEPMPDEDVEALRMLVCGDFVGVLWFAPFSAYAEVGTGPDRELLEDYGDVKDLVDAVLAMLA
jgi:hypothetical protein